MFFIGLMILGLKYVTETQGNYIRGKSMDVIYCKCIDEFKKCNCRDIRYVIVTYVMLT